MWADFKKDADKPVKIQPTQTDNAEKSEVKQVKRIVSTFGAFCIGCFDSLLNYFGGLKINRIAFLHIFLKETSAAKPTTVTKQFDFAGETVT